MKTKNLVKAILLVLLLQSCKSEDENTGIFPKSENVICEVIDTVFIGTPLSMSIYGNDLFIADYYEPMIIHYDLKERKTNKFLSKGRGPGETMPSIVPYANPFGDNKLYVYSHQMTTVGFYSLDSLSGFIPILKLSYIYDNVIPYEKDRYLSFGILFNDEYRYRVLDAKGEVIAKFGDYPDFLEGENEIPFKARAMFHQVKFANNYPKKKLVAGSSYVVDIIDYSSEITDESINRIFLAPYDYEYEVASGPGTGTWAQEKRGTIKGAYSFTCDDKYIYVLFNPGLVREENVGVKKEIWIFDWYGQPVKKLIPDADLRRITADPYSKDHTLFGLTCEKHDNDDHYKFVKIKTNL